MPTEPIKKKPKLGILSPYQEKLCNSPEGCSDFVSKQLLLDQGYNQANAEEFNKYLSIFKNSTGIKDDAWRTSNHISKQGGKSLYKNIEGIPKVDNTKEGFKKGDIIGMYNNTSYGSAYQNIADKNQLYGKGAKNVNTHLGYISEVDDEGNIYVEHYLPGLSGEGIYRRDLLKYDDKSKKYSIYKPQTNGKGLYKGEYDVNSIDRPNYNNFKSNKESLKNLEQEYDNYKFNTSSLDTIKNPYIQKSKEEFLKNAKNLGSLTGLKPNQLEKLFYITLGQGEQETNSGGYNSKSTLDNINNKLSENKLYTNLAAPIAKSITVGIDNIRSTVAEVGNKITGYGPLKPGWKRDLILKQHVKEGKLTEKALNDKQYINDYINQNPEIFGKYNERNSDYSPSSKGWLKSKYVSNLAQNLNIGDYDIQNKPEKAFLNSLLINSENYYRIKNLNPNLKEEDINYLTASMYNQPGLIKNKEYTNNYLKDRNIDYSNKVYKYSKDLYNYNIEPKKQEVNTNMNYKWADINPSTFRNGGRIKKKKPTSTWEPFDTSNPGNIVDVGGINPMKKGGPVKPIIVNDPNDPRLRAYQDTIRDPAVLNRYKLSTGLIPDYILHNQYDQYSNKPQEKNWLDKVDDVLSAPQRAATWALTGKYENPSDALGIQNKWGKMATDMILDPMNLLGVGFLKGAKTVNEAEKVVKTLKGETIAKDLFKGSDYMYEYSKYNPEKYKDILKNTDKYKDIYKEYKIDPNIYKTLTTEQRKLVLNKTGAGAAIINDLIQQDGNIQVTKKDEYIPHYNFPKKTVQPVVYQAGQAIIPDTFSTDTQGRIIRTFVNKKTGNADWEYVKPKSQETPQPVKYPVVKGGQDFPPVDQIMGPAGQQLYRKDFAPEVWDRMAPPRKEIKFADGGTIPQDNTYVSHQNLQNGTSINNSKKLWFNQYPRQMGRMETFKQVVDPVLQFGFDSGSTSGPFTFGRQSVNNYQKEFTSKVNNTTPKNYPITPNKWLHTEDNFGTMLPGKVNKPFIDQPTNLKNSNVSMKYNLSNKTVPKNLVYRVNHNVDVNDAAYVDYGQPMNKVPVDKYFKQEFPDKFKGDVEWDFSKNKNGGIIKNNNMNILNTMVRQYPNRNGIYSYKKGGMVIPKYSFGGALADTGLIVADTALGSLGLNNVIREKNFNTPGGKDAERNYENYGHPIMETISNMVPLYGQIAQAERSAVGQFNPQADGSKRQVNYGALATGAIQGASMAYGASQNRSSKLSTSNASDLVNNTSNNMAYTTPNGVTYNDPYKSQFMALGGPINPNGINQISQLSPKNYNKLLIDVEKDELELDKNGNLVRKFVKQFPHNKFGADPNINYVNATVGNTIVPKDQADEVMNMSLKDRKKRMDVLALNQSIRENKQMRNGIPIAGEGLVVGPRNEPYYDFNDPNASYDFMNNNPSQKGPIAIPGQINQNFMGAYATPPKPGTRFVGQPQLPYNPTRGMYIPANNSVQNPGQFFSGQSNVGNMGYDDLFPTKNSRTRNNSDILTNINKYASLAPAAYNLAMGLFDKPEKLNAGNYTNNQPVIAGKINRRALLDASRNAGAIAKYGSKRNGVASVGNYTNMISDIQNNYSNALANADNMDLQYKLQADQFNSQTRDRNGQMKFRVDDWNSRSKASQRRYLDNAFTDLGQYSSQEVQNQQLMDIYNRIYPKARKGGRV